MKTPRQLTRSEIEFNLTPMIDIVFLLIIFFLVASHFVTRSREETITLPESQFAKADSDAHAHALVVTVKKEGYWMGEDRLTLDQVIARFQLAQSQRAPSQDGSPAGPLEWKVRAAADAPYRLLKPLILACAQTPESTFKLAVDQASEN